MTATELICGNKVNIMNFIQFMMNRLDVRSTNMEMANMFQLLIYMFIYNISDGDRDN